jgi:hypothetical protein
MGALPYISVKGKDLEEVTTKIYLFLTSSFHNSHNLLKGARR